MSGAFSGAFSSGFDIPVPVVNHVLDVGPEINEQRQVLCLGCGWHWSCDDDFAISEAVYYHGGGNVRFREPRWGRRRKSVRTSVPHPRRGGRDRRIRFLPGRRRLGGSAGF